MNKPIEIRPIPDSDSQAKARSIMDDNFLGIEEVSRHFGVIYTVEQLAKLSEIPFSEEMLLVCKDTHVLVAGARLSVNEVHKLAEHVFYDFAWCLREPFANDKKMNVRWYLLRKEPVPKSHCKTYDEQTALLTKEEEVPFTFEVILYWLTHSTSLLREVFVRCQDKGKDGRRVYVGYFRFLGLYVDRCWDNDLYDGLGLASSVIPKS